MLISRIDIFSQGQKIFEKMRFSNANVKTHLLQGNTATVVCAVKHFMLLATPTLISQTSRERVAQFIISYHTIAENRLIYVTKTFKTLK